MAAAGGFESKRWGRFVAALAVASLCALPLTAAAPRAPVAIDRAKLAALGTFVDGVMRQQLATRDVAGAVVTVVQGGKVVFARGYGYAAVEAGRAVDPRRTLFRPGSVSKLFTWTALMQQVELGRVDLAADVDTYLDFKIPPHGRPIKVRDLMTHTPGFGDQSDITAASVDKLVPYGAWLKTHIATRVRDPGLETSYSNYGAALAGYIVERVSHEPFADYVERHIFAPLGMVDTTFREPLDAARAARVANGYKLVDGRLVAKPFELFSDIMPAGSASTTAPDMDRFLLAMLNDGRLGGARILQPSSVRLLESDGFRNAPHLPGLAHGYMVFRESGPRMIEHGGNTADQHSYLLLAPEADLGFFVSETGGPGSYEGRTELVNALIGRLFPQARAARWTADATPPDAAGAYRANRRDYARPANPRNDIKVTLAGAHAIVTDQDGRKLYWEQVGPRLYERVTGTAEGGPFDRLEFYGPADDPRLSIGSEPHELYRKVSGAASD